MSKTKLLILTGDHHQPDATKWDGGYAESDLELHQAMCDAFASIERFDAQVCNRHEELRRTLAKFQPDLVVNFCDTGWNNEASQELHVPALLEILGFRYTGASPQAMVLAYDKSIVRMLGIQLGIACPTEHVLLPGVALSDVVDDIVFPAFVKPAQGDGSVGIRPSSLVTNVTELKNQVSWLRNELAGASVLVQEYLPGPEYGLGLVGNHGNFRALPMLEVDYSALSKDVPPILAFESKTGPSNPYDHVKIKPAGLSEAQRASLEDAAKKLFVRLGCRDYARFDFRTAADGTIRLMEVNPNPAWSREAKLAIMARFADIGYAELLEMIVDAALARAQPSAR